MRFSFYTHIKYQKRSKHLGSCFLVFLLLYPCCCSFFLFLFYRLYSENSFYKYFFFLNLYLNVPLYLWSCWLNWLKCVREKIYNTNFFFFISMFLLFIHYSWSILLTFCSFFLLHFFCIKKANEIMLTITIFFLSKQILARFHHHQSKRFVWYKMWKKTTNTLTHTLKIDWFFWPRRLNSHFIDWFKLKQRYSRKIREF
jgi:hypothetical protein